MDSSSIGTNEYEIIFVLGTILFFCLLEFASGELKRTRRNFGDWMQEAGSWFVLSVLVKPGIVLLSFFLGKLLLPDYLYVLHGVNFWMLLVVYLLVDDVLQYWYHRSAHEYAWLWKLHRPHHQAEEMGFFVSYRNAALYYVLMPNLWWVGLCSFLGGALAVSFGLILKNFIVISSHSTKRWDAVFYKHRILLPVISVLERIIITPAFHYAHHGKSRLDGISDPNGNFGNMFSFWDQLFGTAKFNREFPTDLGLVNDPKEHWTASYFYPLVKSDDPESEISKAFVKEDTRGKEPISVQLAKGEKYLYCACGKSRSQPFCDGSHHGSKFRPVLFEVRKTGSFRLCNCKASKSPPFCDDTHLKL